MRISFILIFLLFQLAAFSQESDTTSKAPKKKLNKWVEFFKEEFKRRTRDTVITPDVLVSSNEAPFLRHQGKVIRRILVREFETAPVTDTAGDVDYFGEKFIKTYLYSNTKEWVIRNNLFIKENATLNATLVAENERYLRSLNYISDARIYVQRIRSKPDSVDLVIVTKDFFSIIAEVSSLSSSRIKTTVGDANLFGTGQRVALTTLIEKTRYPGFGYELLYRNNSIAHTFINGTASYSRIHPHLNDFTSAEHRLMLELERPLVSQYLRVAGAIRFTTGKSENHYKMPDSLFYRYRYDGYDAWIGYNLGVHRLLFLKNVLNRQFISFRYLNNHFRQGPYQLKDQFNFTFNDREAILGQFTLFRQKFYKTSYIFGFGITEDVPYGYNIAFTGGWYRQVQMERAYAGIDLNRYGIGSKGDVMQYFFRGGTFINKGSWQDAAILMGTSIFSRLYLWKNVRVRHFGRLSYTQQFNRIGIDPLTINNTFGLPYIPADSARGDKRISLHAESVLFLNYRLLGFKFAPFASGNISYLSPDRALDNESGIYTGIGGGLRTRNENIQLGTIELRFMYFPRKSEQYNSFKFTITTNLRFRSNFNYIKAPEIIELNSDINNNIY